MKKFNKYGANHKNQSNNFYNPNQTYQNMLNDVFYVSISNFLTGEHATTSFAKLPQHKFNLDMAILKNQLYMTEVMMDLTKDGKTIPHLMTVVHSASSQMDCQNIVMPGISKFLIFAKNFSNLDENTKITTSLIMGHQIDYNCYQNETEYETATVERHTELAQSFLGSFSKSA